MSSLKKGLYIVSTPIGNLDDITLRAKKILEEVGLIICENPKHSLKLLNKFGIKKKLISLHDYNEEKIIKNIKEKQRNTSIALISDSGSPLISDPGFKLVKNFIKNNIYVTSIPGPSAIISSLQMSGLSINNFSFFGFVPKNENSSTQLINKFDKMDLTGVFFISGKRLQKFLESISKIITNCEISICKEITKLNEATFRGAPKNLIQEISNKKISLKGEFTIVVEKKKKKRMVSINDSIKEQISTLLNKFTLTETVQIVHKLSNISRKDIYKMALNIKND